MSVYLQILRWWHDFGITLTLSIFATLAFEAPILGIEKAIFGRGDAKPAPKKPAVAESEKVVPTTEQTADIAPATNVVEQEPEIQPIASRAEDPSKA